MLRVGVDMIEVSRLERAAQRHGERFFARFFTPQERAYCQDQPRRLAARLAAKEAVGKALGTGIGDVMWVEIEIAHDERGRPILRLHGEAARLAADMGLSQWDISLSHTEENALAFVVAMGG
jgi:holo-[acyl-carrier protein] synthase